MSPLLPNPPSQSLPNEPEKDQDQEQEDEQAFQAFVQTQDAWDVEAALWVARRRNGLDADGEAALHRWLSAHPQHARACDELQGLVGDVRSLLASEAAAALAAQLAPQLAPQLASQGVAPRAGGPRVQEAHADPAPTVPWRRSAPVPAHSPFRPRWNVLRQRAGAVAAVCVMVCGSWLGWAHWRQQAIFEQVFASARGQQRTVHLPDAEQGSTVQLDTATRLTARLYRDRREVLLEDGQALFSVKSDRDRPFHVWAGGVRITVVGTRFSVRSTAAGVDAGKTVVSVQEGRVRVVRARTLSDFGQAGQAAQSVDDVGNPQTSGGAGAGAVELVAGEAVAADAAGQLGPVTRVPVSDVASWRDGRISFDQTPLAQAIEEFERYGPTGLVVNDPALAALPVGGSYHRKDWQHFARTLGQVLPVRLVQRANHTEVVARSLNP